MKKSTLILCLLLTIRLLWSQTGGQYTLIISMDGFRWDYPELYDLQNISEFGSEGVRAVSLQPSFPSKTFPNHYTLATGLYPAHHGIVHNSFFDPEKDDHYSIPDRDAVLDASWYGGEPIWVTAEKQGVPTASFYWVASEAKIGGYYPSYYKNYVHGFPYEQRIDTVIKWFQLPEYERPQLVMLYFDQPDGAGHDYGPEHPETGKVLARMDSLFGVLLQKTSQLSIADSLNIILLSDHGMGVIDEGRSIQLDEFVKESWVGEVQGGNPVYNMQVKEHCLDSVMRALLAFRDHLSVYRNGMAPEHLHYGDNPRILDLTVLADSAWSIYWGERKYASKGTHGYDPRNKDMHAIFMAKGPAFREKVVVPAFENVEVYGIIARILGLKPAKTDGDLKRVSSLFER